jgi:hypothetical protein
MRKFVLVLLVAAAGVAVPSAFADQPTMTPINDSGTLDFPAGTACDFHYFVSFTDTGSQTVFSDRTEAHFVETVTHVNVDTGYTLTERDQINLTIYPDGTAKEVAIVWHLRDASGKLVVEHAGQVIVDPSGNIVKITPHIGPAGAALICPALGGSPA